MKKIWDDQSKQSLFAIDEDALRNKVIKKKNKASAMANRTEQYLIGSLIIASSIIWAATIYKVEYQVLPLALSGFMIVMAILFYIKRVKRLKWQNDFKSSMLGDLDHAIANAEYQLQISRLSKVLFFAVAAITIVDIFSVEEWWKSLLTLGFFVIVYSLAKWEYKTFYLSQHNSLKSMREKFLNLEAEQQ